MTKRGEVAWLDLTVDDADGVRDFYASVVGWTPEGLDMGGYQDWVMNDPDSGDGMAGVCYRRGGNADAPGGWMVYLRVDDLDAALDAVREKGGEVISPVRSFGAARIAAIRDPSGATCALVEGDAAAEA